MENIDQVAEKIDLNALAQAIAHHMHKMPPKDAILWDAADCAAYFKKDERYYVDYYSKQPGHPRPVVLDNDSKKPRRCWYMSEIIAYGKSKKLKSA